MRGSLPDPARASAPAQLSAAIPFQLLPVASLTTQRDLEDYFVKCVFLGHEEVALQVLEHNLIEGRNTVVSVVNLNSPQQVYPFVEDVSHLAMV